MGNNKSDLNQKTMDNTNKKETNGNDNSVVNRSVIENSNVVATANFILSSSEAIANGNDVKISSNLINKMDDNNKEVAQIWNNKGVDEAVKFMTKDVINGKMSYAEMRAKYG